ncbi:MAG TPA: CRISPR-associated protein Cas4 [Anaerolineae bacterium]|nr:CRISPR-associated protein Cas4 [Anaerolineae bacterium]
MPFLLALILILIGLFVFWLGRRAQTEAGLPIGRVIYSDTRGWQSIEKPLFSRTHRLTGKPDYLVQQGREIIPVEVKSAPAPQAGPRRSHVLQLAAYCLLVEETYRQRPKYGIVKYADQMFAVDYTAALHTALLDVIASMRDDLARAEARRSHTEAARCAHCGYRHACEERLA